MNATHYFATCIFGYATAPTREEAIEALVNRWRRDLKGVVKNCHKDGIPGAYLWTCKVNAAEDAGYRIEWFMPKDVDIEDTQEHAITYLTDKQLAYCRTYEGEAKALRERLDAIESGDEEVTS